LIGFLTHRLLSAIPILFGVSVVGFLLMKVLPGDPTFYLLGPWASEGAREALLTRLGWDLPVPVQYYRWLVGFLQGDFGMSTTYGVPVAQIFGQRVANSTALVAFAFIIAASFGFGGGILAALRQFSLFDRLITGTTIVLASAPVFWLGLLLVYLFSIRLTILPATGMYATGREGEFLDLLSHVLLPAITAALIPMAVIFRLTRSAMADVLAQPYIQAARARGIPERTIILRHAVRNILAPIVNITGLQLGFIFGGALFSEVIFNWPGIGFLVFESLGARDVPVIQTVVLFTGALFVGINLLTDIAQAVIDPRTRSH
jgi:peptide/nickel transport system permease protein